MGEGIEGTASIPQYQRVAYLASENGDSFPGLLLQNGTQ
jgi:hypothetical protein